MSSASVTPSLAGLRRPRWPVIKPVEPETDRPSIRLNRASCVIGDRSRVHLRLASPLVSRAHALIVIDERDVYVRDLASRNRVFVNGSAVREASLRAADLLRVGPYQFRCWAGFAARGQADRRGPGRVSGSLSWIGSGEAHPISDRTFLIGRRPGCDLPIAEQTVSRVHAVVFRRAGRHVVRDLNSRNGTFVNGERVREAELNDGDELQIHRAALRYRAAIEAETEAVEPETEEVAEMDGLAVPEPWDGAVTDRSAVGLLSSSGSSVGDRTTGASSDEQTIRLTEVSAADPLPATPGDFDFGEEPPAPLEPAGAEPGLITAAELFPTETSLSSGVALRVDDEILDRANRAFPNPGSNHNGNANGNGNGRH